MTDDASGRDDDEVSLDALLARPDPDGVTYLHDTEADSGDESELTDAFDLDRQEARELGVELDSADPDEPLLD